MAKLVNNETTQEQSCIEKFGQLLIMFIRAVDGWDFKAIYLRDFILSFISENITEFFNAAEHEQETSILIMQRNF